MSRQAQPSQSPFARNILYFSLLSQLSEPLTERFIFTEAMVYIYKKKLIKAAFIDTYIYKLTLLTLHRKRYSIAQHIRSTLTYIEVFMRRVHDDLPDCLGVARVGEHIDVAAEVIFLRPNRVGAFRAL